MNNTIRWTPAMRWLLAATMLLAIGVGDAQAGVTLFRCEHQGQVSITDRPSDQAECQPLAVSTTSRADATPIPSPTSKKPAVTKHHSGETIASEQIKTQQRCERIRLRIDEIGNKMRSGYSAEQGERLKERKKTLEAELRIEHCS